MSESIDSTHYQVALTNGQVLTAFGVLLGCILAAFFAGVWIGRGATGNELMQVANARAEEPDAKQFNFFSGDSPADEPAAGSADEASTPESTRPARTAAKPVAKAPEPKRVAPTQRSSEPAATAAASPARAETPPPEPMRRTGAVPSSAPSTPEAAPAAQPAAEPPPAKAETAVAASAPAQATADGFLIQVFASADQSKAQALVDKLVDADFNAFLAPTDTPGSEVYRVRVGPLPSREVAQRQAAEMKRRWGLESWISPSGA
jgi:hypothetical protein